MTLADYLARYPELARLYQQAQRYLPQLPSPHEVALESWPSLPPDPHHPSHRIRAYAGQRNGHPVVAFADDPPSRYVLLHEAIHLAGGDEVEASNYAPILEAVIRLELPRMDLLFALRRFEHDPLLLDSLLRRIPWLREPRLDELYQQWGIIPSGSSPAGNLLAEIAGGLPFDDPVAVQLLQILWEMLSEEAALP